MFDVTWESLLGTSGVVSTQLIVIYRYFKLHFRSHSLTWESLLGTSGVVSTQLIVIYRYFKLHFRISDQRTGPDPQVLNNSMTQRTTDVLPLMLSLTVMKAKGIILTSDKFSRRLKTILMVNTTRNTLYSNLMKETLLQETASRHILTLRFTSVRHECCSYCRTFLLHCPKSSEAYWYKIGW